MTLTDFWFAVITMLWTGFFVLEGFDFGVGILHGVLGRGEAGRRAAINTIGPLWDGNEVWLIVAGAAMFAAFPGWYATMFSGFNLALVVLLAALIVRGLSFEWRGKGLGPRWRRTWDGLLTTGSVLAPLLIGVALGDLLHGLPINASQEYTGSFFTLLQPYGLFTGVTLVALCVLHGATFLALKTTGDLRDRAGRLARRAAPVTGLLVLGCCPRAPRGRRVRRHHDRDGRIRTVDLHRALPAGDGLQHQPGLYAHHSQHRIGLLCAESDDDRRGDLPAVRARLSSLDLLRLPPAHQCRRIRPGRWPAGPRVIG